MSADMHMNYSNPLLSRFISQAVSPYMQQVLCLFPVNAFTNDFLENVKRTGFVLHLILENCNPSM